MVKETTEHKSIQPLFIPVYAILTTQLLYINQTIVRTPPATGQPTTKQGITKKHESQSGIQKDKTENNERIHFNQHPKQPSREPTKNLQAVQSWPDNTASAHKIPHPPTDPGPPYRWKILERPVDRSSQEKEVRIQGKPKIAKSDNAKHPFPINLPNSPCTSNVSALIIHIGTKLTTHMRAHRTMPTKH